MTGAASVVDAAQPLLSVRDLCIRFPLPDSGQTLRAVDGVSFDVMAGETFGIIGESGSGKTTLGRALVSLLRPTEGQVLHAGVDPQTLSARALRQHRRDYQVIFQDPHAALNPRQRVLDSVCEPLEIAGGMGAAERERRALQALDRVGIASEYAQRYPHMLSGGQKQRINIARALTLRPKLIVCDEVVAALDVSIRGDVLNLFADLQLELGLTYVFITHDLSVVSHVSDRIAVTYLGKLMEVGPTEAVSERPLHPYTEALMSADPLPLPSHLRSQRRIMLQGEIPSPIDPPSGCRFRTRCPSVQPRCAAEAPAWRELRPAHWAACHYASADGPPARPPDAALARPGP